MLVYLVFCKTDDYLVDIFESKETAIKLVEDLGITEYYWVCRGVQMIEED